MLMTCSAAKVKALFFCRDLKFGRTLTLFDDDDDDDGGGGGDNDDDDDDDDDREEDWPQYLDSKYLGLEG